MIWKKIMPKRRMRALPCLTLLALALSASALAQDEKSSPLPNHLPLGEENCYGRAYDADESRKHRMAAMTRPSDAGVRRSGDCCARTGRLHDS